MKEKRQRKKKKSRKHVSSIRKKGGTRKFIFYPGNNEDQEWFFAWLLNKLLRRNRLSSSEKEEVKKFCNSSGQDLNCIDRLVNQKSKMVKDAMRKMERANQAYSDREEKVLSHFFNLFYEDASKEILFVLLHTPRAELLKKLDEIKFELNMHNNNNLRGLDGDEKKESDYTKLHGFDDKKKEFVLANIKEIEQMLSKASFSSDQEKNANYSLEDQIAIRAFIADFFPELSEEERSALFEEYIRLPKPQLLKKVLLIRDNLFAKRIRDSSVKNPTPKSDFIRLRRYEDFVDTLKNIKRNSHRVG